MFEKWLSVIKQCGLFRGLADDDIISLMPCFSAYASDYNKGDILFQAGDSQQTLGLVLTGEVNVQKEDPAGNRFLINVLRQGELFGEVSAFANLGHWANTVLAGSDCKVLFIRIDRISRPCCSVCQAHQILIENMLFLVSNKALVMNSRINYLKMKGMREKLASYLLEQSEINSNMTFDLPINREALADYLNVSRPSMSRELGRMRDEGVIDFYRSSFIIRDPKAIRAML
jgi:CRP-like cAMP-binding protein